MNGRVSTTALILDLQSSETAEVAGQLRLRGQSALLPSLPPRVSSLAPRGGNGFSRTRPRLGPASVALESLIPFEDDDVVFEDF